MDLGYKVTSLPTTLPAKGSYDFSGTTRYRGDCLGNRYDHLQIEDDHPASATRQNLPTPRLERRNPCKSSQRLQSPTEQTTRHGQGLCIRVVPQ